MQFTKRLTSHDNKKLQATACIFLTSKTITQFSKRMKAIALIWKQPFV